MKTQASDRFFRLFFDRPGSGPRLAHIELTYRCNLDCVHCYCKDSPRPAKEFSTSEFKKLFNALHDEGCLWLNLTGGEPLLRKDFLELYNYAKKKGFIISLFTNGLLLSGDILKALVASPPRAIEITLNAITEPTYETLTQSSGAFSRVIDNISSAHDAGLPLLIKTNILTLNRSEIVKIKQWVEMHLGKPYGRHLFRYDTMIYPRLNGDRSPCQYRLSPQDLLDVTSGDPDMAKEHRSYLMCRADDQSRESEYLYHCDSWKTHAIIDPCGRLKFCPYSDKYSVDLRKESFKEGFFQIAGRVSGQKFKSDSLCRRCPSRSICAYCPARAFLETGNEEGPVDYYCERTKFILKQEKVARGALQEATA